MRSIFQQDHDAFSSSPGGKASLKIGLDAMERAAGPYFRDDPKYSSTWWEWVSGSTPFFWNWPDQYQDEVRDGQPHFLTDDFGVFVKPQRRPENEEVGKLIKKKAVPVHLKGYIEVGAVVSIIHYFYVPKGLDNVRMVYDGTGCGLNAALWAPHFGLPTVRHTTRSLLPGYF